ncbi:inositol 1,4,5-trisphosphate receptor type 2-like isoform X2 [Mercenaria mercenaria]|uniref:inositol 1,4,5-trisphosphate receptor type 2-like isoform X2 n=1 Tax=Mercenaria mercenaria TaxID=6596 RepID=UPI00234F2D33|nr:inositol 1,4,5-trisphosphate receptor type 2-like isoform X2 [Mercenaria mercenaria]
MADDTLCIGDVVCLYSAESYGFVFSSQSSSVHNEVAVGSKQDKVKPDVKDQNLLSFEVCIANRYKLNKTYRKIQSKIEEDPNNYALRSQHHQAQLAAKAETDDNEQEQKRQQGKKLLYGQIIQLKHRFTLKYIHVSTTTTSPTESNNMAVELHDYDAKHAQFKVMPRYKVKAEGDVVQVDDQIVFESVKSSGQYLHVSKTLLGGQSVYQKRESDNSTDGNYELNLSVQQSGFTIFRKYKPSPDDEKKVKVGDIVRFYHKEMEAYLVAEGLFDDELTEDVHLRMRPVDQSNPKTLFPSSSAVTYWQIELQEGCVAGGVLKWEQQCRLMHMCTRKYLCVAQGGKVSLTSDHLDPKTVFRLHPVIRESDDIPEDSYCRMEHVVSGQWLHASMDEYKKKQEERKSDSKSMGSLKWTTAQLKKIGVIEEKQYDDAFTLQSVDQSLEDIFNTMAGMVPFIQKLVHDKKAGVVLNAKMSHNVITALKEICNFMVVDGEPIKDRQKLMRNLRIVELLVNLLKCPFNGADQYHMTRIFSVAYDVLYTYLMGNSRKNELYIAKYIDFFLTQFEIKEGSIGLNAAHMVMELIRDNRKIVDRITHDHIDKFVDLLRRDKNYHYLDLLSVLCVCDGVSIADNQKYITEVWLMRGMNCVFFTDLGQKIGLDDGKVYVSTNNGKSYVDLFTFSNRNVDQHRDKDDDEYLFLEHQLELFGYLCHGQNSHSIAVITQELNYLTWEEAFTCLSDDRLPDQLRAMYCDLIITMFVDIADNHSVVDRVKLSYIYDDVDNEENRTDNTQSLTYQYFPQISQWISDFLGRNGDMTASLIGNNMLVRQVLRLVHYLVLFGFYDKSEDIKKLLEPLMSLLDGRNDKPYPNCEGKEAQEMLVVFRQSERFKPSPETKAIVEAKVQALQVLDLFFNFIFNIRLEKFINLFKTTNQMANRPGGSAELAPLMYDSFELEQTPVYTLETNEWRKTKFQKVTVNYQNLEVARAGMKRLTEIFEITSFMKGYEIVDILLDLSHYEYDDMVRKSMHLLNRYFSAHNNLYKRAVQAQVLITDGSVHVYKELEEKLPVLRRLSANKLGDSEANQLAEILEEFIHFCHLEGEEEEPHAMNQSILYNNGIIEDAFSILSQEIDVKLLDQYTGLRQVFEKTFILLKRLARENKVVQERLFDRLDLLLSKEGAAPELAEALTEVFTGNSKTCMKIAQHQVQKIMALVAEHKSSVPQFLDLLNAVVKVEELDLPLKRNQGFVMTYFMQFRSEVAVVIDQDEKARESILTSSHSGDLNFLISMVDLLATCAEGENRFIESICQTIFKIPELLKVLNNPNINDNLKRPFLRFFLWVYLNTASGMIESGAGDIPHDPAMWGYLTSLSGTLVTVTEYCRNNPEIVKQLLKKPPGRSERGVDRSEQTRGSLHYLFDAVMPFLQIFCRSYYQIDTAMYPNEPQQMDTLATNFKNFLESIAPLVSIERQMQSLISCMSVLFSSATLSTEDMEEFQEKYGQGVSGQDVRSDARKAYEEYYEGEEEINTQLNVFAVNMKVAYGGVNDVQTQIGYPSKVPYSEVGGDEELPLGAEFQAHISSFINNSAKNPLEKYKMAEKLIKQLAISTTLTNLSEKERIEQLDLDIKCMQLLRGILHNEIIKLPEDFENDVKSCKKQLKVIEDVQNALNHYGSIDGTLEHLSRPNDEVVRELLAFLAALLFNGNEEVQTSMFEFFTGTREETFFFAIKSRVTLSTIATRERRVLQAMHHAKIEETIAQAKALKKAMKNGAMATMAVVSLRKNLVNSMTSMRKSMASLTGARPSSKSSRKPGSSRADTNQKSHMLVPPGEPAGSLKPPMAGQMPNGLEMKKMQNSRLSFASGSKTGNKVAPVVPEIDIENVDEEEFEQLLAEAGEMPDLEFKDDGYIELVLRILGLMCDNQHNGLQNYLREQPDNIKSVNLVAETTKFLNILYSNINANSIALITQVFETLVEFTSGNGTNQAVVFDNKVCDYVNHILRVGVYKDCMDEEVYSLKRAIGILVRCLTEENPKANEDDTQANLPKLTKKKEVMEYLDTDVLVNTMTEAWKAYETNADEDLDTLLQGVGFQYYHLLARKLDLNHELDKDSILKTDEHKAAFEYYSDSTLSIEIIKDDALQKIYFRVKDKKVLREEIKDKFKYEVDRSSPSNKIRDFMDWSSDIIKDIKYQRRVYANPVGRLLVNAWIPLNYSMMLITLAISIVIMVTWEEGSTSTPRYKPAYRYSNAGTTIYVLGGIHNFLSLGIFFSYVISNRPTFPSFSDIVSVFKRGDDDDDDDDRGWSEKKGESHLEVKAYGFKTIYYVLFLGCSVAGTVTDGYFFAFHLLHITELNQLLKRVIQAVTTNGKSLMLVALLGLAIFYIYSLILFAFYRDWMWSADSGRHCRTIYECFVSVLHHGLVEGPYTQFENQMGSNFAQAIGITFFDVSFFIIITTIGLNIIFGIIVDTFSQLRDSKWEIDKDMQNNCFICSRESYDFERQGGGFQKHVRQEHYQWAYLFFFIHLDETRPNDYSALELYVYKLLTTNNFDFFPLNRALSLENEEDTNEQRMEHLQQQIDYLVAKMKDQEADQVREKEKQRQQEWERTHKKNDRSHP